MNKAIKILSGMGLLIGMFLVLKNGAATAEIINSIGKTTAGTVKTLQGRG